MTDGLAVHRWLADKLLRIDSRSLGLFRIALGIALVADLLHRWDWLHAFYSNEGVLPNHNHLFQLREQGEVWSVYHAFSSEGEATFAFAVTLAFYLCFLLGWHTRLFSVVALVCLVSLAGRNILLDGPGTSLAIALLALGSLLPLGDRFSVDALVRSLRARDEKTPRELNDRASPSDPQAPPSLAALATLLLVGLVPFLAAVQQNGEAWKSGEALHYALHTDRWTSALGVALRDNGSLTSAWTYALRFAELAVLPLALVPAARRITRPIAMGALAFAGLSYGLLFTMGLWGWTLLAASLLLVPSETWDAARKATRPIRLVYDADCGICLWLARLVKRLDLRRNVTFIGNDGELPEGVDRATVERTIVVVDAAGEAHTDAAAVSRVLRSLPLLGWLGLLVAAPGLRALVERLYYRVAERRFDISAALGMGACGIDQPAAADETEPSERATPRWARAVRVTFETALAAAILAIVLAQSERAADLPVETGLGERQALVSAASWARITGEWGVFAPEPPRVNESLLLEGELRGGAVVDLLTGYPPDAELSDPKRRRLGVLWAAYADRIRLDEHRGFRTELRKYMQRGGRLRETSDTSVGVGRVDAFWVSAPIAAPGEPTPDEVRRYDLFGPTPAPDSRTDEREIDPARLRGLPTLKTQLRQLR